MYTSIAIMFCAIFAWNTEKHQFGEFAAKTELKRIGTIDYLTNTANRLKMKEEADRWINFCHRQGLPLCIVFIDVDDLKLINDRYGHPVGDSVLMDLASLTCNQLRSSDILARWGGDEFVLLLPNITLENAVLSCERIKNSIASKTFVKNMNITCSFGVVSMKEDSVFESLIQEADELMYNGKKHGKNSVQWSK